MSTATAKLLAIQSGDASAEEAMKALREVLKDHGAGCVNAVRTALRGWTWKAMQTRRADTELRDWYRVIRTVSGLLEKLDGRAAAYVEALAHLVEESVRFAEARPRADLLARAHVVTLLQHVAGAGGSIERAKLAQEAEVSSSRLSQILTELTVAGALERSASGRQTAYALTPIGKALLVEARAKARIKTAPAALAPPPAPLPETIEASAALLRNHREVLTALALTKGDVRSEQERAGRMGTYLSEQRPAPRQTAGRPIDHQERWLSGMDPMVRAEPQGEFGEMVSSPAYLRDLRHVPHGPERRFSPFLFVEPAAEDHYVVA